jgi:flagellar biosynthesis protein FlhF
LRIKKFEGRSEKEVIDQVKEELGLDALVLNIKKRKPRGIFAFFIKPTVEVTAAYDDKEEKKKESLSFAEKLSEQQQRDKENKDGLDKMLKEKKINEQDEKIKQLQQKLASTEEMLTKAVAHLSISMHKLKDNERKYQNNMIQIFYEALVEQGVLPEIAEELLNDLDQLAEEDEPDINMIVKIVYNKLIEILGGPATIDIAQKANGDPAVVAFIGSTGVGKTTTIAKLSADLILNKQREVGLITADTYRIAAVEQLKTYAEILGVEVNVVYSPEELAGFVASMRAMNDVIMIDTAGRSHKNAANMAELGELLSVVPEAHKFLVLSLTTKYEDLLSIVKAHADITEFHLIFTKLDETLCYGSILNVCYTTGKKVSYVTMGQNVPEDIEAAKPEKIAKALLGLGESDEDGSSGKAQKSI